MLDAEQLRAAYAHGYVSELAVSITAEEWSVTDDRARVAGLAEVARQQAEHDAQIADGMTAAYMHQGGTRMNNAPAYEVAVAIRAQFDRPAANPITATPEKN